MIVPPGEFLTGPIRLLSNVDLHLSAGATLRFSTDPSRYLPVVLTRWEGVELMNYAPLVYAFGQQNVAVTGSGTLDGQADATHWWPWKAKTGAESQKPDRDRLFRQAEEGIPPEQRIYGAGHFLRPPFLQIYRCTNVLIEGVTIRNSPFWVIHPVLSLERHRARRHGALPRPEQRRLRPRVVDGRPHRGHAVRHGGRLHRDQVRTQRRRPPPRGAVRAHRHPQLPHAGRPRGRDDRQRGHAAASATSSPSATRCRAPTSIAASASRPTRRGEASSRTSSCGTPRSARWAPRSTSTCSTRPQTRIRHISSTPWSATSRVERLTVNKAAFALSIVGLESSPVGGLVIRDSVFRNVSRGNRLAHAGPVLLENVTLDPAPPPRP